VHPPTAQHTTPHLNTPCPAPPQQRLHQESLAYRAEAARLQGVLEDLQMQEAGGGGPGPISRLPTPLPRQLPPTVTQVRVAKSWVAWCGVCFMGL
jgi:hypothetical protein